MELKSAHHELNEAIQVLQGHFVSKAEYQKFRQIDILENDQSGMIRRLKKLYRKTCTYSVLHTGGRYYKSRYCQI